MLRQITIRLLPLLLLVGLAQPGVAEPVASVPEAMGITRVTIKVLGLACPFCTYNLEKRIKTLAGVPKDHNWQASVEDGQASFDWQPTVPFEAEAVREQIRKAGFTPDWMEITSTGAGRDPVTTRIPDSAQAGQDGAHKND